MENLKKANDKKKLISSIFMLLKRDCAVSVKDSSELKAAQGSEGAQIEHFGMCGI